MMFKKAVIIGCPGAGKSTFARGLHKTTNIPLYYLDMIWHREDKTTVPREEFDARLAEILERESWIIDGNYQRTLEAFLSVNWSSGHYPEKLVIAMKNFETVYTAWDENNLIGLICAIDDGI